MKRELIVIGGANGSGKTTFAREIVAEKGLKYLGADDIAFELDAKNFETVKIEAARIFSKRLTESLENGESLIIESTLAGLSLKKHLQKAKQNGYSISIFFVFLDSVELCLKRIKSRVENGGHNVPENDVRRRFLRANDNFWNIYKKLADEWFLILNADDAFENIVNGDSEGIEIFDETRFLQWKKKITN
ncbi:MAG TPA: zeta toxin family protein [Pyrinomonadaceae bacterium]|nr:zeta toxin family protein [Pyrinomonadaceae bacterium]